MPELPKMPKHVQYCNAPQSYMEGCDFTCASCKYNICTGDCPACLYINLAKWLRKQKFLTIRSIGVEILIPISDWAEIKRLAEEG